MKIIQFVVTALHGFMDVDISFRDDITVIVGRNGSGKTSALNLISHILSLDIPSINKTKFSNALLKLVDPTIGEVIVNITPDGMDRELHLQIGDKKLSIPISDSFDPNRSTLIEMRKMFFALENSTRISNRTDFEKARDDKLIWTSLSKLFTDNVKLTFVRLDRTILAIDSDGREAIESMTKFASKSGKMQSIDPIDEVTRVTTQRYVEYKRRVEEIKNSAFKLLLGLHFEPIVAPTGRAKVGQSQLRQKLSQLRKRVEKSALFSDSSDIQKQMASFFDSFEKLLPEVPTQKKVGRRSLAEESIQVLLGVKEKQIENLLTIFDNEQEDAAKAYSQIRTYLFAASKFLKESGKILDFDANLQLAFTIPNESANSNGQSHARSLKELSSGERQVIIVLTYLAFLAGEKSIFIIDEPELSLHLRWQGYLIEALKALRPKNCQVIVATHAPEIVGRSKQNVVLLAPSYLPKEV